MSKYCFNCGYQLPDAANFCIKCGQNQNPQQSQPQQQPSMTPPMQQQMQQPIQPVSQPVQQPIPQDNIPMQAVEPESNLQQPEASPVEQSGSPDTPVQPSEPAEAPVDEAQITETDNSTAIQNDSSQLQDELGQMVERKSLTDNIASILSKDLPVGPLSNENTVVNKKVELGYSADPNNFIFTATPVNWSDLLTVSGLAGMKSQNYIMSFESTGILLMGCDGLVKFNDDNHFIKNEDISNIDLERRLLQDWDRMYLTVSGEEVEMLIMNPAFTLTKWHRRNCKNVLVYTL